MVKSDLKTGMVVKIHNDFYLVIYINNELHFLSNDGWMPGNEYDELLNNTDPGWNITRVYNSKSTGLGPGLRTYINDVVEQSKILWTRKPVTDSIVELTIEQIACRLGIKPSILRIKDSKN